MQLGAGAERSRRTLVFASLVVALSAVAAGCSLDSTGLGAFGADAARPWDASASIDASRSDAGGVDAGGRDAGALDASAADAGAPDAGAPDAGTDAAAAGDAGLDASVPDAGPGDFLVEAEDYSRTASADGVHMWLTETSLAGYSGTGYIIARRASGSYAWCDAPALGSCGASVAYDFAVSGAVAVYHVHVRATGAGTGADSIWWALDATPPVSRAIDATSTWTWTDVGTATLASGPHTLTLHMREPGARLDRIFISASAAPPP